MGSFGSDRPDIACTDTEVFDGHLSPPTCSGEDTDKGSYSSGTVHFYDDEFETQLVNLAGESQLVNFAGESQQLNPAGETQVVNPAGETQVVNPIDDEFETQVVNPAGETQAFNITGETQILSLSGETQLLDDPDCSGNMDFNTQILNDFDDEVASDSDDDGGTETTEIMVDDDLSSDESPQSFDQSVDREKGQLTSLRERDGTKDLEELPDNLKGPTRFASIRAASLRASGLAARSSALQTRNPRSSPAMSDKNVEELSSKDNHVDRQTNLGQCCENVGELGSIKCRVGSSAVRKLFTEDPTPAGDAGNRHTSHDDQLTACDNQLAGLSYVDSQEPGDFTQANALDFVEKFLEDNSMEFDQGGTCKLDGMVQSKSVPNPKGQYNLANIVNCIRTVGESRVFDWDDNREDEGGGELFCRRKEEFFGGRGSNGHIFFTEPRKLEGRKPDSNDDKGGSLRMKNMKSRLFCSDSRLGLSNEKENNESAREAIVKCKKNLCTKLDQQNDRNTCRGELDDNDDIKSDEQEVSNVGFDTQMAAEAMEALFHGENIDKLVNNEENQHLENSSKHSFGGSSAGKLDNSLNSRQPSSSTRGRASSSKFVSWQSKKRQTVNTKENERLVLSQKFSGNLMKPGRNKTVKFSEKSKKTDTDEISGNGNTGRVSCNGSSTVQKRLLRGEVVEVSPVAHRTRHSMIENQSKKAKIASGECEQLNHFTEVGPLIKKRSSNQATRDSKAKRTRAPKAVSCAPGEHKIHGPSKPEALNTKSKKGTKNGATCSVGEQSSCDTLVGQASLSDKLLGQTVNRRKRSYSMKKTRSSLCVLSPLSLNENLERPAVYRTSAENVQCRSITADMNGEVSMQDFNGTNAVQQLNKKNDECMVSSVVKTTLESPSKRRKPSKTVCTTPPDNCRTPMNDASPVCMGNEYYKQSCKKSPTKSCLLKEIRNLSATGLVSGSLSTESRKRKDMNDVRVLYSHHLDEDIIKQQKKTLARLGVSVAPSITEATHFIADKFVRTRNMLEAIALGKLVVTHLWIESCGQASCFIDEKNYILRDAKKEKEFGFSMPGSLACARQRPLLEGRRVLITQNTKPGKDVISSLVKAVKGQAVERIGRSMLKDDQIPDNLLVLSCEEDYDICVPFLEKGAAVYSSELLLNGIVTQKLEFERHRLFVDHVKRTRSTIWLKKDGKKFQPVTKHQ